MVVNGGGSGVVDIADFNATSGGRPTPSSADVETTEVYKNVGQFLGLELVERSLRAPSKA